jgi:hypothetical protein
MPKLTDRFLAALSVDKDRKDRLVFRYRVAWAGRACDREGDPDIHCAMDGSGHKTQGT